ncbi:hypothetical protein [Promineifilum sp.]|uniref:hypothetical protein n=1 Tax=Promineifilum sp. TaxID=2664178 RepID=UPI0035B1B993
MKDKHRPLIAPALLGLLLLAALALAGLPAGVARSEGAAPAITPVSFGYLPFVRALAPTQTPSNAAALLTITPNAAINASTFNSGSFIVENQSLSGQRLTQLRIDLGTAILPDVVFDPHGKAGDTVAKDVARDQESGMSLSGWSYEVAHDGGYEVLLLRFGGFDRGDRFKFSVDIDPTSIQGVGAPGPAESGSVGGLELVGATVTATFSDGATLTNQVYRRPDAGAGSGAVVALRAGAPELPVIAIPGITAPMTVSAPNQTVRVTGPAGRSVVVLVVEGGLFTEGLPDDGFDLDPFEANSALIAREYTAVVGSGEAVDVPILLSRSMAEGGINTITAVFEDSDGLKGLVAAPLVLELE